MSTKSESVVSRLSIVAQCGIPALWIDLPGKGKTAIAGDIATGLGMGFESISMAYVMPEDMSGLPVPNGDQHCKRLYDTWAWNASKNPTLVLFDEFTRASSSAAMNAGLRVFQEHMVGDMHLHTDTAIIATANPSETDSGCRDIPAAMANRVYWDYGQVPTSAWHNWMMGGQGAESDTVKLSKDWKDSIPQARALVTGFLTHRPGLEYDMPKDPIKQSGPWPSRRSWANAATVYGAAMSIGDKDMGLMLMSGLVGTGVAVEFLNYMREMDLPDPEDMIQHPDKFPVVGRADRLLTALYSVIAYARQVPGDKQELIRRFKACEKILCRLHKESNEGTAVVGFSVLSSRFPDGKHPAEKGCMMDVQTSMLFGSTLRNVGAMG